MVRPATENDVDDIARVIIDARTACLAFLNWEYSHDIMVSVFRRKMSDSSYWVAEGDGAIVGFIAFSPDEIDNLYVSPSYHDRGIGSKLLDEAFSQAAEEIRLWVFQENRRARRFYERHGFTLEFETDGQDNMEKTPDARYVCGRA